MHRSIPVFLLPLLTLAGPALPSEVLPFIPDDYPKAVAQAKAKDLPLFVEAWAPW